MRECLREKTDEPAIRRRCRRSASKAKAPSSERQQSTVRGDDHGAVERGPSQKLATVPKMHIFLAVELRHTDIQRHSRGFVHEARAGCHRLDGQDGPTAAQQRSEDASENGGQQRPGRAARRPCAESCAPCFDSAGPSLTTYVRRGRSRAAHAKTLHQSPKRVLRPLAAHTESDSPLRVPETPGLSRAGHSPLRVPETPGLSRGLRASTVAGTHDSTRSRPPFRLYFFR